MDIYSMIRFFNQFISRMKKPIKKIGIITDKDGTILLNEELRETLKNLKNRNMDQEIYIIANSGRTVSDMINSLEKEDIPAEYFDYIIGDNGAMCIDINQDEEIFKHVMDRDIVSTVINHFLENNGEIRNIRIADGENIFAYPDDDVREYYKNINGITFKEDICDIEDIDATKLTLVGTHEQIEELNDFVKNNLEGYKTHIGITKFPNNSENQYRMDFTGLNSKGTATKFIREYLDLDLCICLGNDLNDVSMFYEAIEHNDFVVIAHCEKPKITEMIVELLETQCKLKGIDWEKAGMLLLKEKDVNKFLLKTNRILGNIKNRQRYRDPKKRHDYKKTNQEEMIKQKEAEKQSMNVNPTYR